MSTQLRIVHKTGYTYRGGATASFNEVRMTPRSTHEQFVLHSRLEVSPTPWLHTNVDYWGNDVTTFEIHERHDQLHVVATSTVDIERSPAPVDSVGWDGLQVNEVTDGLCEYLELEGLVDPGPDLIARVAELRTGCETPRELVDAVRSLVNAEVRFVAGSTSVKAPASTAWAQRSGVARDFAHIMIGALRSAGVPARYVSGYYLPEPEPGVPTRGYSHAWVDYWDGGWSGADPTYDMAPGNFHVDVAHGRDYNDTAPLRGIFTGTGTSQMFVDVEITQVRSRR